MNKKNSHGRARWLVTAAVVASLGLAAAGTAAADVRLINGGGFIGRGDVIAYAGKDKLVETANVLLQENSLYSGTCVRSDGTRVPGTRLDGSISIWLAHARHAPGNGTITGYTLDLVNGESSAGFPTCVGMFVDATLVSNTTVLTFEGVQIPISSIG
jgi:hypothetical protein